MTLEEEITHVAESLADKCVNPRHRGCNLWRWKKEDYEKGIRGWIEYKLFHDENVGISNSMPGSTMKSLNPNT